MESAMRATTIRPLAEISARRAATAPWSWIGVLWRRVALWRALARERRALATLDPRLLRDIGLDAGDAAREADRPFWDAPEGR